MCAVYRLAVWLKFCNRAKVSCPVTGDQLGADGKPIKVPLPGRTVVFVCCKDCVADLKRNPDRFLTNR